MPSSALTASAPFFVPVILSGMKGQPSAARLLLSPITVFRAANGRPYIELSNAVSALSVGAAIGRPPGFCLCGNKTDNWAFSLPTPFWHLPHQREASTLSLRHCLEGKGRLRPAPHVGAGAHTGPHRQRPVLCSCHPERNEGAAIGSSPSAVTNNGFPGGHWPPAGFLPLWEQNG